VWLYTPMLQLHSSLTTWYPGSFRMSKMLILRGQSIYRLVICWFPMPLHCCSGLAIVPRIRSCKVFVRLLFFACSHPVMEHVCPDLFAWGAMVPWTPLCTHMCPSKGVRDPSRPGGLVMYGSPSCSLATSVIPFLAEQTLIEG
jgi:hypothetical protein